MLLLLLWPVLCAPLALGYVVDYNTSCSWIKDHTTATTLDPLERLLLDQCIFHNRTSAFEHFHTRKHENIPTEQLMGRTQVTLRDVPPSHAVNFRLDGAYLFWITTDERARTLSVGGYLKVSWRDDRLTWSPKDFLGASSIQLDEAIVAHDLWIPTIRALEQEVTPVYDATDSFSPSRPPVISHDGYVNATYFFKLSTATFFDYSQFPYDEHLTCYEMEVEARGHIEGQLLNVKSVPGNAVLHSAGIRQGYHPTDHDWQIKSLPIHPSAPPFSGFAICVKMQRRAATARVALYMPLMLSCVLSVFAPLFGTYKIQAVMKVVALVLQYFCLMNFMGWLAGLPLGEDLPLVLRYYEFVMILTMLSLVVGLMIWAVSRMQYKKAPPAMLVSLANMLNSLFMCSDFTDPAARYEPTPDANANQATPEETKAADWKVLALGLNNFFFAVFGLIYLLGTMVLA